MPQNELVTGRLLRHPLSSQIASVQRTRREQPTKVVSWFKHHERNPDAWQDAFPMLSEADQATVKDLHRIYEATLDARCPLLNGHGHDTEDGVHVMGMADAFEVMADLAKAVATKHGNGLIIIGAGGLGKTWTVMEAVASAELREGHDYIRIPGYSTPLALFNTLYKHSSKLIIFDDCDSIFKDLTGLNILKSTLDTLPRREVHWRSTGTRAEVEDFEFTGRVIFISNMNPDKVKNENFQALLTRVYTLIISSTRQEVLHRMSQLLPTIAEESGLSMEAREEILRYLHDEGETMQQPNLRWLKHICNLRKYSATNWQKLAKAIQV